MDIVGDEPLAHVRKGAGGFWSACFIRGMVTDMTSSPSQVSSAPITLPTDVLPSTCPGHGPSLCGSLPSGVAMLSSTTLRLFGHVPSNLTTQQFTSVPALLSIFYV